MNKKIMILSCLVNVDGLSPEHSNRISSELSNIIYEKLKNDELDVRCLVFPVTNQPTEIKCIYPKYLNNNDNFYAWFDKFIIEFSKNSLIGNLNAPIQLSDKLSSLIEEYKNIRNNFDDTGNNELNDVLFKLDQIKDMLQENINNQE